MLNKLPINFETNLVDEILNNLTPDLRKAAIKSIKKQLVKKNVKLHSHSDFTVLAEKNLTLREIRNIFREFAGMIRFDPGEIKELKAYYLEQRFNRVTSGNEKLRKTITRELKKTLLQRGVITESEIISWSKLTFKQRFKMIVFNAANHLDYLELEGVFNHVLSPEDSLPAIVKQARNIDIIKKLTNSEILPFLQKLIIHEKEIPGPDIKEALETIITLFISDHHYYKLAANKYFTLSDVYGILERSIGLPNRQGKIGQKAAGMILAYKIWTNEKSEFTSRIKIPESYYLTSDVFFESLRSHTYNFSALKYRLKEGSINENDLENEYPRIRQLILETRIPDIIRIELRRILMQFGRRPLIVRSSSLLEDSVSSFSGKYDSYFFANQKTHEDPEEDLENRVDILIEKILRVYASVLKPEALIYRRERGLLDIDERMSVLIQAVEGRRFGKYFFPALAGVGLSYNQRVNSEKLRWDAPVLRLGVGLGTGIVEMKGNQVKVIYPGNPDYSPIVDFYEKLKTSQRKFDVLNLETDEVETISKTELFEYFNSNSKSNENFRDFLRLMDKYFLSVAEQDYLLEGTVLDLKMDPQKHIFTLDGMKKTGFYKMTEWGLRKLTEKYQPADIEFTVGFYPPEDSEESDIKNYFDLTLVQCRQLTGLLEHRYYDIPQNIPEANIICSVDRGVVSGYVPNAEYIVYVDPDKYYELDEIRMYSVARFIGLLNRNFKGIRYILIGPGRWGSSTPYYGVKVVYSEIYDTLALVEIVRVLSDGAYSEPSLGSHFGNDVREGRILPMSIYPGAEGSVFNSGIITNSPNLLHEHFKGAPLEDWVEAVIKVIDVKSLPSEKTDPDKQTLHVIANSEDQRAVMFIGEYKEVKRTLHEKPVKSINEAPTIGI